MDLYNKLVGAVAHNRPWILHKIYLIHIAKNCGRVWAPAPTGLRIKFALLKNHGQARRPAPTGIANQIDFAEKPGAGVGTRPYEWQIRFTAILHCNPFDIEFLCNI